MTLLEPIVGFAIGIVGNYIATTTQPPIPNPWQRRLEEQLADEESLRNALSSQRSFREEIRNVCGALSQDRALLGNLSDQEREVWRLLRDPAFQENFTDWLMAGAIEEGDAARTRLEGRIASALVRAGATPEQVAVFRAQYIESLDRAIFSVPMLAAWRHQLSLIYLREQVEAVRRAAEKAAGIYSEETQHAALDRYYEAVLKAWDIIDLSNLPEGDVHIATQKLLLRQLYMPLRVTVAVRGEYANNDDEFASLEQQRVERRLWEAGRLDTSATANQGQKRIPAGTRLGIAQRLVILGDPGGGKTTLLRWMATAYALRERDVPSYRHMPDIETLPDRYWLPVLIRCRDLGVADLCRSFTDFLAQHFLKSELQPEEAEVMTSIIQDNIAIGEVLLLVDGLDEITDPQVRVQFCQELERTAARYPTTSIIVTSRIVGYRDMPYRMGGGFEHAVIADLSPQDRDDFAHRWVGVTEQHQPAVEQKQRAQELIEALHSSNRIERLTGNPMLLTTLALVKRKVGKLPSRRTKLYAEAVSVLLNWNPRHYQTIDEAEAIPQLAYIAYEMCHRGVQQLIEDDVLNLLDRIRQEYPNVRAIRRRSGQEFLDLLESRSSILIKSGGQWWRQHSREQAVWEFRHLTFQEYLAARALIDGRYPGREGRKPLAEEVAALAGFLKESSPELKSASELEVTDSWQEVLRLLIADCKDDDVDTTLLAIATPLPHEDAARTMKPRVVLAVRCLADEPNVSEEVAHDILNRFVSQVSQDDGHALLLTNIDSAVFELKNTIWGEVLRKYLLQAFFQRTTEDFWNCGGLWALIEVACAPEDQGKLTGWVNMMVAQLDAIEEQEAAAAALVIMKLAEGIVSLSVANVATKLFHLSTRNEPIRCAAVWALDILRDMYPLRIQRGEVQMLLSMLLSTEGIRQRTVYHLVRILGHSNDLLVVEPLITFLDHQESTLRHAVVESLGQLGDTRAVEPLLTRLDDQDASVRRAVVESLGQLGDTRAVEPLLTRLDDQNASVRRAIVKSLGQLGDTRAVEPLLTRLDDQDVSVQQAAAQSLGQLGDTRPFEPLLAHLDDQDESVRRAATQSLGQLGDARAVEPLLARLDDQDESVRRAAAQSLGRLGDTRAVEPLLALLDDQDAPLWRFAVQSLGRLGDTRAVEPLLARLDDQNASVRLAVAKSLGQLGDARAVEPLLGRLDDQDASVRLAVAKSLGQLGDARAVELLLARLDDQDASVRQAATQSLGQLGDARAVEPLLARLDDRDILMPRLVAQSLGRLGDVRSKLDTDKEMLDN